MAVLPIHTKPTYARLCNKHPYISRCEIKERTLFLRVTLETEPRSTSRFIWEMFMGPFNAKAFSMIRDTSSLDSEILFKCLRTPRRRCILFNGSP